MVLGRLHKIGIAMSVVALCAAAAVRLTHHEKPGVEPLLLGWDNLLPQSEHAQAKAAAFAAAGLVYDLVTPETVPVPDRKALQKKEGAPNAALDNKQVAIAGYVVPLEYVGTRVKQFLLVPYFGACIHVPPPPPNQIVLVRMTEPAEVNTDFAPVVVSGLMRVASASTSMADVAYQIVARSVTPYE